MISADEYFSRVKQVALDAGHTWENDELRFNLTAETISEAKILLSSIGQLQKELRQIKREVSAEMQEIRASYKDQSANVSVGGWSFLMGRGRERTVLADKKRKLEQQRNSELAPYNALNQYIDRLLVQFDGAKLKIQKWRDEQK